MSRRPPSAVPRGAAANNHNNNNNKGSSASPSPSSSFPPSSSPAPPLTARASSSNHNARAFGLRPSAQSSAAAAVPPPSSSTSNRRRPVATAVPLKLVWCDELGSVCELALKDARLTIGRSRASVVCLARDGQVSNVHAEIINGFLADVGSTNGTIVNQQPVLPRRPTRLMAKDVIRCGTTELRVEAGEPVKRSAEALSRSKEFPAPFDWGQRESNAQSPHSPLQSEDTDGPNPHPKPALSEEKENVEGGVAVPVDSPSVDDLMDAEFRRIIGHESIKVQLRQFYKKVQLDRIRAAHGKDTDKKRLYHMIFSGPPGKTTMANVVARLLLRMGLVQSSNVVFVNNSLELLGSYVGQTPLKVDAKVAEAAGGVLFIDEAYSIVKEGGGRDGNGASFGKEAIDTLMKHLDPPSCVMIFAGYTQQMEDFLSVNPGLARRIPYRYHFHAYTNEQLQNIFTVMCEAKGETMGMGVKEEFPALLAGLDGSWLENQNAGLISNWLSFAQMERDDRIDLNEAELQPNLASTLEMQDLIKAIQSLESMNNNNNHQHSKAEKQQQQHHAGQ